MFFIANLEEINMDKQEKDESIFVLVDDDGNDHLVKRDVNVSSSIIPPNLPPENLFGFILLDSLNIPQNTEIATFIDIMNGKRFRVSTRRLRPYASTG